jgi:membrane protease YdiL (CAAX protease family)
VFTVACILAAVWFAAQSIAVEMGRIVAHWTHRPTRITRDEVLDWRELARRLTNADPQSEDALGRLLRALDDETRRRLATMRDETPAATDQAAILAKINFALEHEVLVDSRASSDFWRDDRADEHPLGANRRALESALKDVLEPRWLVRGGFVATAALHTLVFLALPALLWVFVRVRPYELGLHFHRAKSFVPFGFAQLLVWWPLVALATVLVRELMPRMSAHPAERFLLAAHGIGDWLLLAVSVLVCAPLGEELLFRGVVQGWLTRRLDARAAIAVASTLFGLAHFSTWPDPIPLVLFGIGLGTTYQRTRSLWSPIALHAGFNAIMLIVGYIESG